MTYRLGPYVFNNPLILAPMAGITDVPFRRLCHRMGAGLVVSEMVTSDSRLWHSNKSKHRLVHDAEIAPRSVQIAGGDPHMMAEAAALNVAMGAQIIDINMGCPAKKVCNKAAGSALLKDEKLVQRILEAVVNRVSVPVTLKIRTGWSSEQKNALIVAKMAEAIGVSAIAVHGRTRACKFKGEAEYDSIAEIKQNIDIPVFANGDINSPEKAKFIKKHTQADALMIGRAAQGKPWIFREIHHYLHTGAILPPPSKEEVADIVINHVKALHAFYGAYAGIRIARKHVGWYLQTLVDETSFRGMFNRIESAGEQLHNLTQFFTDSGSTAKLFQNAKFN